MTRRLLLLAGGALALWALVAVPARRLGGEAAVTYSGAAVLVCLLPMALTLAAADLALRRNPRAYLLVVLAGTGLRLFLVLAGGIALAALVPYFRELAFGVWLVVFYLATLALEVALMLAAQAGPTPRTEARPTHGPG